MKRFPGIMPCLCAVLLLISFLSGCTLLEKADSGLYSAEVLADLTREATEYERLPGLTEDLCVILDEGIFDSSLIDASAAGLFSEDTKEVLYAKKSTKKMYPASLTKCMTALLVLESGLDLSAEITVGEEVSEFTDSASLSGLKAGYSYSVEELLVALLVPSGNDAANALAVAVSGSVSSFVAKMNERAQELGMLNTHFVNPHGLHDKNHYTTVYDLYLLTRVLLEKETFLRIASLEESGISGTAPGGLTDMQSYKSTNSYLRNYTVPPKGLSVMASKTGYTVKAGRCLILAVRDREGKRYIGIVMNANTYDKLYLEMNSLLAMAAE